MHTFLLSCSSPWVSSTSPGEREAPASSPFSLELGKQLSKGSSWTFIFSLANQHSTKIVLGSASRPKASSDSAVMPPSWPHVCSGCDACIHVRVVWTSCLLGKGESLVCRNMCQLETSSGLLPSWAHSNLGSGLSRLLSWSMHPRVFFVTLPFYGFGWI